MTDETVKNMQVSVDMFHLMYARKLGILPKEYALKMSEDVKFRKSVQDAYDGYAIAIQAVRLHIVRGSKLSIDEIGPGVAKIRLGIGEWDINNTPKNAEVALDDFLLENNFLVSAS